MSEIAFKNQAEIEKRICVRRAGNSISAAPPQVSVIVPCYKNAAVIADTLRSIFAQDFDDYEVILINDGSPDTDELEKAVAPFADRIVYVKQCNSGASAARNTGIYAARGEYLAFLDGDDLWLPEYLREQMNFITARSFQMVYADALMFGAKPWEGQTYMRKSPSDGDVTAASLILGHCNVITSGTIVEKRQIMLRQGFDERDEATRVEDFDLWLGLAKQGCRIGYQKKVLLKYRVTTTGLSGGNISRAERTIKAMHLIKAKNALDAAEIEAWETQVKFAGAHLELEKGKLCLVRDEFEQSFIHFTEANKVFRKRKLQLLIWLVKRKPQFVKKIFKTFRADEFESFDSANL